MLSVIFINRAVRIRAGASKIDTWMDGWMDGCMYTYAEGPEMLRGARLLPPPLLEHRPHRSAARQGSSERSPQRLSAQRL